MCENETKREKREEKKRKMSMNRIMNGIEWARIIVTYKKSYQTKDRNIILLLHQNKTCVLLSHIQGFISV